MKHIRPLAGWKKQNAESLYALMLDVTTHSKKSEDNLLYMWCCWRNTHRLTGIVKEPPNFYFNERGYHKNKGLKVLIGQIIAYGMYYEVEDFGNNIGANIIKLHSKENDVYCKAAAKYIKNNFAYYYHNPSKLDEWYNILKEKNNKKEHEKNKLQPIH